MVVWCLCRKRDHLKLISQPVRTCPLWFPFRGQGHPWWILNGHAFLPGQSQLWNHHETLFLSDSPMAQGKPTPDRGWESRAAPSPALSLKWLISILVLSVKLLRHIFASSFVSPHQSSWSKSPGLPLPETHASLLDSPTGPTEFVVCRADPTSYSPLLPGSSTFPGTLWAFHKCIQNVMPRNRGQKTEISSDFFWEAHKTLFLW